MALIAARLNVGVILAVTASVAIRYIISLFELPHLYSPVPNKAYGFCGRKTP